MDVRKIEVDVRELAARLDELLAQAAAGNEVVITVDGQPRAWLNPIRQPGGPRPIGFARGSVAWIAPDFDDPLPDEFWLGGEP